MSDLLIKCVEMPKTCGECPACQFGTPYMELQCLITDESIHFDAAKKRAGNCPLIELPTHGKLIDANRLENIFWDILSKPDKYDKPLHDMMLELQDAPTIIEGEK